LRINKGLTVERRRVSAVQADINKELNRLLRLDSENQRRFSGSANMYQLELLTESIFFSAYRAYENFLEDTFVLYCLEKESVSGKKYGSYLKPKNFSHARELIQSSMTHLDWTSPDNVISRAETYLLDGEPFKTPVASSLESLRDMKKLRNHIAHNSRDSKGPYISVITKHYRTVPLKEPSPGKYLLEMVSRSNPQKYYLVKYIEDIKNVVTAICQ